MVFFSSEENSKTSLWYLRIRPEQQGAAKVQLTTGQLSSDSTVRAVSNSDGDIFIFWNKFIGGNISRYGAGVIQGLRMGSGVQIAPGVFGTGSGIGAVADSWDNIWTVYINNFLRKGSSMGN